MAKAGVASPIDAEMATRCTDTLNNTAGGLLATRNATTLRIFLYNHPTMSSTTGMTCNMTVHLPTGVSRTALAHATLARIDETHTNPKAKFWQTPYYAIINTAVGGSNEWPHMPDNTSHFPMWHYVDYWRVSQPRGALVEESR